ncbi:hypothetical protein LZ30DRAFT_323859 [Colletotrichum cereale]|nr:hypothetical protein LZ30DRAFT_323859 [Colletotrichum cereale]
MMCSYVMYVGLAVSRSKQICIFILLIISTKCASCAAGPSSSLSIRIVPRHAECQWRVSLADIQRPSVSDFRETDPSTPHNARFHRPCQERPIHPGGADLGAQTGAGADGRLYGARAGPESLACCRSPTQSCPSSAYTLNMEWSSSYVFSGVSSFPSTAAQPCYPADNTCTSLKLSS